MPEEPLRQSFDAMRFCRPFMNTRPPVEFRMWLPVNCEPIERWAEIAMPPALVVGPIRLPSTMTFDVSRQRMPCCGPTRALCAITPPNTIVFSSVSPTWMPSGPVVSTAFTVDTRMLSVASDLEPPKRMPI